MTPTTSLIPAERTIVDHARASEIDHESREALNALVVRAADEYPITAVSSMEQIQDWRTLVEHAIIRLIDAEHPEFSFDTLHLDVTLERATVRFHLELTVSSRLYRRKGAVLYGNDSVIAHGEAHVNNIDRRQLTKLEAEAFAEACQSMVDLLAGCHRSVPFGAMLKAGAAKLAEDYDLGPFGKNLTLNASASGPADSDVRTSIGLRISSQPCWIDLAGLQEHPVAYHINVSSRYLN